MRRQIPVKPGVSVAMAQPVSTTASRAVLVAAAGQAVAAQEVPVARAVAALVGHRMGCSRRASTISRCAPAPFAVASVGVAPRAGSADLRGPMATTARVAVVVMADRLVLEMRLGRVLELRVGHPTDGSTSMVPARRSTTPRSSKETRGPAGLGPLAVTTGPRWLPTSTPSRYYFALALVAQLDRARHF